MAAEYTINDFIPNCIFKKKNTASGGHYWCSVATIDRLNSNISFTTKGILNDAEKKDIIDFIRSSSFEKIDKQIFFPCIG